MPGKRTLKATVLVLTLAGVAAPDRAVGAVAPPLEGPFATNFNLLNPPVPAPLEAFEDLTGRRVRLADFKGLVVLVNFWATWCPPCIREMPSLDRLQAELGGEGLAVLAVSVDRGGLGVVTPFVAKLGLRSLGLFLDPDAALMGAFAVRGLPATFLIDARGRVVGAMTGPAEWDSPEAVALVRHYLRDLRAPPTEAGGPVNVNMGGARPLNRQAMNPASGPTPTASPATTE